MNMVILNVLNINTINGRVNHCNGKMIHCKLIYINYETQKLNKLTLNVFLFIKDQLLVFSAS